jgi:hypothetical protein
LFFTSGICIKAQAAYILTLDDSLALENVIIEKYYISESSDSPYSDKSSLPLGSVTYRIFIDLRTGYDLQMVYGSQNHELYIKSSTPFYNDTICYAYTGFNVDALKINQNSVAFDSWITMGAATRLHTGIPLSDDKDGSIINRMSFKDADGLTKGNLPYFQKFNIDLKCFFNNNNTGLLVADNGGWSAPGGLKGPTDENKVLIAQITTNGKFTFKINIQVGTPGGGAIKFVAESPEALEIQFDGLSFN